MDYFPKMTEDLHNLFFYANTCHVCKSSVNEAQLKKCSNCKMISYCGKDHQKQHWQQHKKLCKILSEMLAESKTPNFLTDMVNCDQDTWVKAKMNLMLLVSLKLQSKLLPYEEEMFKFPRACSVCHNTNSKLLTDCQMCSSASFCIKHRNDKSHSKVCALLAMCYELDIASTVFLRQAPRNVVPFHTEKAYLPSTMKNFIDLYINEDVSIPLSAELKTAHASEYFTRPLTLLYVMEKLDYTPNSKITIHVIGANIIELDGIELWETLLHWLPSLNNLSLILIGPDFDKKSKKLERSVCDCCKDKGMKFQVETHGFLYKEYAESKYFSKPDIIIGYNLGIHESENIDSLNDKWPESLCILPMQKCPFIITSYTEDECKKEHKRLCDILIKQVDYMISEKNPFCSLRPHRDYESEGVYYQNQYVTIYNKLN